jgi:F-type H+-transporting ATPase subunit gamma
MSGNAKAIRTRIKSVESTMHITRAMQLVASSKMRRATDRMEGSRYFFDAVSEAFCDLAAGKSSSPYLTVRPVKRSLCIVLAGDRGLAGGYNANVFREAKELLADKNPTILAIGRRACDHFEHHGSAMTAQYPSLEKLTLTDCVKIGEQVRDLFLTGEVDEVHLIYTEYVSALSQVTKSKQLLPVLPPENALPRQALTEYEPSAGAVLNAIIPQYITGILWGALCMSFASELASRRNAMDSATKNASDMIDRLSLSYNRARQSAITQEITEIVAGAEQS